MGPIDIHGSSVSTLLQVQLSKAELAGSLTSLQQELATIKAANVQLQSLLANKEKSWQDLALALQAEHDKQVCMRAV